MNLEEGDRVEIIEELMSKSTVPRRTDSYIATYIKPHSVGHRNKSRVEFDSGEQWWIVDKAITPIEIDCHHEPVWHDTKKQYICLWCDLE